MISLIDPQALFDCTSYPDSHFVKDEPNRIKAQEKGQGNSVTMAEGGKRMPRNPEESFWT